MLGRGFLSAGVLAFLIATCFSLGAATGASIAHNESANVSDVTGELDEVPNQLERNLSQNMTGAREDVVLGLIMPVTEAATYASKSGVYVGHEFPLLGRLFPYLTALGTVLGGGYYVHRLVKQLRQQVRHNR